MLNYSLEKILLWMLKIYRDYISCYFPARCRFYPSCSHYAYESIKIHGGAKGICLAFCRLLKCHPWHEGGHDPVPPRHCNFYASCCCKSAPSQSSNLSEDFL